ncbi:MAG: SpoIIE family protein phosphatase [Bryobacteraceae bacterium]|jgi:sigma-B regulation protein RsbU (phosphoserine phosphatase)
MVVRLKTALRKIGRLERVFLLLLALAVIARYLSPASGTELLLAFAAFVAGVLVALRWLIVVIRKVIWRLRYRLLVAYLFIAVVPIVLIVILVWLGAEKFTGQIAAYLVTAELERRTNEIFGPARGLAWTPPANRTERANWLAPYFWSRFPGFELLIRDETSWRYPENASITAPPEAWRDASGLILKNHTLYVWAHAIHESTEVTMLAPVTSETLASLAPGLGELAVRDLKTRLDIVPRGRNPVPPPVNVFDLEVSNMVPLPVAVWEAPGQTQNPVLIVVTRYSAVLQTVFGQRGEWTKGFGPASLALLYILFFAVLFLVVELVAVVIGIRLTRTITRAVHNLYVGTQRVREGVFSHRIEVRGDDQLAELSDSFNRMTENLERLVQVAKEKERLQSELEIAREVQNQLFPKSTPVSKTLRLTAACTPARLVSGDYYDYLNLEDSTIALAIGDVAGKGISAALLMATVQSTMRTQLRAGRDFAAAGGNGGKQPALSTATLVSRLNQQLYAYTPPEKFATFYFALYDDETGWMNYTNAGHLPPILVHKGVASRLEVTGTVVGAFSFSEYGESSVRLEPGDLLACFTDGITEPENEFGEMFGEDRLTEVVVKNSERDTGEIVTVVMDSVRQWTGSPKLQDDMTLLLARRI